MEQSRIIKALGQLGRLMQHLGDEMEWDNFELGVTSDELASLKGVIGKEFFLNPWYTKPSVLTALKGCAFLLDEHRLTEFAKKYTYTSKPKNVGLIFAGNLPLVGLHDLICVLLSGHRAVCKLSSQDNRLLPAFLRHLFDWEPELRDRIEISLGPIGSIDAIIATGSSNSVVHFKSYFGHIPHIFRGNRTSVAVLDGTETDEELKLLGKDLFTYFGLGCRNVNHLILLNEVDLNRFFEGIVAYGDIINHHKYANNYDYNRTIFLMNQVPFLDNNFCLLKEDEALHSPLSVIHYSKKTKVELKKWLEENQHEIQVVVGKDFAPFGSSQMPGLLDYADGVDTMKFLNDLI